MSRLEVRVELVIRPDTEDFVEALAEANALLESLKDGWYAPVRFGSAPRVTEVDDDDD